MCLGVRKFFSSLPFFFIFSPVLYFSIRLSLPTLFPFSFCLLSPYLFSFQFCSVLRLFNSYAQLFASRSYMFDLYFVSLSLSFVFYVSSILFSADS
jgi:hypothetical protein